MKISISDPPIPGVKGTPTILQNRQYQVFNEPTYIYPMVPSYAATILDKAGHEVVWDDAIAEELSYDQWFERVARIDPDLIFMETKTPVIKTHWRIIDQIKQMNPEIKVVLAGDHVSALPSESMESSQVDFILTGGDFDFLLLNLVNWLEGRGKLEPGIWYRENGKIKNTGKFKLNHDLNTLPFIDRDLTRWRLYAYKNGNFKRAPGTYTMVGRDCVAYGTNILLEADGDFKFVKIGDFIDQHIEADKEKVEYQGVTEVLKVKGIKVFSFNPLTLEVRLYDVEEILRKPSLDYLYYVRTESGRILEVTATHPMFVLEDGKIEEKLASELKVGDYCVVPIKLHVDHEIEEVDLIEESLKLDLKTYQKYRAGGEIIKKILHSKKLSFWKNFLGVKGYKRNKWDCIVGKWRVSGRIPLTAFAKIDEKFDVDYRKLTIVSKGGKKPIPSVVKTDDLARFLGYLLSDGHVSSNKVFCYFDLDEEDLVKDFRECVKRAFQLETFTKIRKDRNGRDSWITVGVPNSTLAKILRDVFQTPSNKKNASIPSILFKLPKSATESFLASYIAGDGCGVKDSVLIRSTSKDLVDGICHLLIKCGIPFHVRACKKQKPSYGTPLEISITKNYAEDLAKKSMMGKKRERQINEILWKSRGPLYSRLVPVNHVGLKEIVQSNRGKIPCKLKGVIYRERTSLEKVIKILSNIDADKANKIRKIIGGDIRFDRVVEIKRVEYDRPHVYDLYVPEASNFLSGFGGIITHNCWWRKNGGCTFCSWTALYTNWRVRKPELLVDEIGFLIENYGVKTVFDDTGTFVVGNYLRKFCRLMIERGYNEEVDFSCNMRFGACSLEDYKLMKRAGFRMLLFGLESASQKTLDRINKGLRVEEISSSCRKAKEAGLEPHVTIMVGFPWETRDDAVRTFELAKDLFERGYADTLQATIVIPYPGTRLFEECKEKGLLATEDWDDYDMGRMVMKAPLSEEDVKEMTQRMYRLFLSPRYVLRRLVNIRSIEDLEFIFRGAKKVFGHLKDFSVER